MIRASPPLETVRPIDIGDELKPYGKLEAKYFISGERYYFFVMEGGLSTAMMPSSTIDPMWEAQCLRP